MKSFVFLYIHPCSFFIFLFFSLFLISTFVTLFLVRGVWDSGEENCARLVFGGGLPERRREPSDVNTSRHEPSQNMSRANHCMWACLQRKLRVSRIQVHNFVSTVQTRNAAKSFLDGIAGFKAAVSEV